MGKSKNKNRSASEHLRGEIRRLKKQLRQSEKINHFFDEENTQNKEVIEIKKIANCPNCNNGHLKLILSLDTKDYYECNSCEFRKSMKK